MRYLIILFYLFIPSIAFADHGFGTVADNLMEPVTILAGLVGSASIIVGVTSLFSAFIKYMQHRVNPLASPFSTVVLLIVIGIVLVALPSIYKFTESGIPYRLYL